MQVKKQQLEPDMEQQTGSKFGKEYIKAVCCHPGYLTYLQSISCEMPGWMTHKLESRLLGKISAIRYLDDTTLIAEIKEELKSLLMKVREESKRAGLKLNIQKTKIMASSPITSWQIDGEKMETVSDFIFLGSKITADSDYSHQIKRCLLLGRGFSGSSAGIESACNAGDPRSILGLGRSLGEGKVYPLQYSWASQVAQLVKNLPAVRETWVRSLGWEYPLEKGKATHSSILAWRIPGNV